MSKSAHFLTGSVCFSVALVAGVALTQAVTEPRTVTQVRHERVEVEVALTPDACADALAEAERVILTAAEMGEHVAQASALSADAVIAAAERDWEALEALTADVTAVNEDIDRVSLTVADSNYAALRDECLAEHS